MSAWEMTGDLLALRLYDPDEVLPDGYPAAWHHDSWQPAGSGSDRRNAPVKNIIRALYMFRCERCGHPYPPGIAADHARGEWTPCDDHCTHPGPIRYRFGREEWCDFGVLATLGWTSARATALKNVSEVQAQWRILTVHHLNGVKWDCRWWNLAALCQRCHLAIQAKVLMERVYPLEHSEWFKPHAAGWYAASYLGEELTREETEARLDELLALERLA